MNSKVMLKWVTFLAIDTGAPYHYIEGIEVNQMSSTNHVGSPRLAFGENMCKLACPCLFMWAGVNQPVHWFLGGKGFRHPTRNKCMDRFAQIVHVEAIHVKKRRFQIRVL
jgi:hypothetical protein